MMLLCRCTLYLCKLSAVVVPVVFLITTTGQFVCVQMITFERSDPLNLDFGVMICLDSL